MFSTFDLDYITDDNLLMMNFSRQFYYSLDPAKHFTNESRNLTPFVLIENAPEGFGICIKYRAKCTQFPVFTDRVGPCRVVEQRE